MTERPASSSMRPTPRPLVACEEDDGRARGGSCSCCGLASGLPGGVPGAGGRERAGGGVSGPASIFHSASAACSFPGSVPTSSHATGGASRSSEASSAAGGEEPLPPSPPSPAASEATPLSGAAARRILWGRDEPGPSFSGLATKFFCGLKRTKRGSRSKRALKRQSATQVIS